MEDLPFSLPAASLLGQVESSTDSAPFEQGRWLTFYEEGAGLEYRFAPGALAHSAYLTADFLLAGDELAVFVIQLQEGETGPVFGYSFGFLNQCQARLRMPLEAVNLNRWMYPREGALLKPLAQGQRVDLSRVDRLRLVMLRFSGKPARLCMTPLTAPAVEPPLLRDPLLPEGVLLDELGQSAQRGWPEKTGSEEELSQRLNEQLQAASAAAWPQGFSKWGGWLDRQWQATGFFRTAQEEGRWWLVDPDGHPFWSVGLDCVDLNIDSACTGLEKALAWQPPVEGAFAPAHLEGHWGQQAVNYLIANFIRAFGESWYERWSEIIPALLRGWGVNTIANWSDWRVAAKASFPYVRPLQENFPRSRTIYRSFPDVFHPDFEADAVDYAQQLVETRDDPAFIGYFLQNEPTWGFSSETLAEGMLFNTLECATRRALADFLRQRYKTESAFASAWGYTGDFQDVASGPWTTRLNDVARADLEAFSTQMVDKFYGTLNTACKAVDPNHLNLGARYYTAPPDWVLNGMRGFDVFSINCYREQVPADDLARLESALNVPVLVGEWHFGALDAGLPASGIGAVADQAARGQAYRFYVEQAARIPSCVGVHYFTLYDQSALGRFDGENYNIGFLDVCHHPYAPLVDAARLTHQRLYPVAAGELDPYEEAPHYLPRVFL